MTQKAFASWRLRWLGLVLFLCAMVAVAAWSVFRLPVPVVDRMIEADIRKQAQLWSRGITMHLDHLSETFATGALDEHDIEFLMLMPNTSDAYRLTLLAADGRVIWSTREDEIGTLTQDAPFFDVVARGGTHFTLSERPITEVDGLLPVDEPVQTGSLRCIAEVYTPVMLNGQFLGALKFYADVSERRQTFAKRLQLVLAALSSFALLTMCITMLVIYRTNRARFAALQSRSETERTLMDEQLRLAREVRLLGELNEWLQSCRSLEELFAMVSRFMEHILPDAEGSLYVYSNSRDVLDGSAGWNGGAFKDHIHPEACWGLRRGRSYEYGASEVDFVCDHAEPHDGRPYFCFPVLAHGETVGLMHLRAQPGAEAEFSASKRLAQMCAEQISMAIANVRMRDQLHDQSVRDPLTGLFNRRHLTETLRKQLLHCQTRGGRLSLIAVDVDHFKKFNDTHGHDAGDMVLRAVGAALEQACDRDEVACRIGGEEFMLVLLDCAPEDALTRAELLRQSVEEVSVRYGEKTLPRVTISAGVAHYPRHGTMPQDLMRAADDALYEAKGLGRNQVRVAQSPGTDPREAQAAKPAKAKDPKTPEGKFAAE
ncbi:diguanylate cyclase, putative [Ruegeria pomeroyi DSS-3]|uniref:diguanylate cyclase n=2 Tax=Ruegeria pomeroyi TaxID=89184 RepID=Q5LU85_RUEPO|nr:diguanylate cyclase [Ruegeria pomeroyi]AAV94469.1 diguanylate cyclase, putative [Ruegeria pomeroyi DSS-3]